MTLGGLALAIGILVDQSIVVLENIMRHVQMGKNPPQAALDGTQEVVVPIFISTVTFAVVFFPTMFLSGLASYLFTPLALATIIAIVVSFVLSITLVPLGFVGVVAILMLTGSNLSIMSAMGIIMMVGIVVEYSIVLVDFANRRLAEGLSVKEAVVDAAKVRARPILMTSLTTWLALLPMAIGSFGGEANAPLARAIIGGVIAATVLSLLVVPCLYVIFKRPPKEQKQWATT